MSYDLLIEKGNVVTETGIQKLAIAIKDSKFAAFFKDGEELPESKETIDASGKTILPGMIEPHMHIWDPGEDWESGTQAAAAGGVTTFLEMPLTTPPTINKEAFLSKKELALSMAHIDFGLWGGVIPESAANLANNLLDLKSLGAFAIKIFMAWSGESFPPIDDGLLFQVMQELARANLILGIHAENDAIIQDHVKRFKAAGRNSPQDFIDSRPPEAELEAINRALLLGKVSGCPIHIVHMG